jgi:ribosomal protein S12 methylthiotransferase accessory factor
MGFGAHLDARIAINRAVTEMNQFIPAVLNVDDKGDSSYLFDDPEAIQWWQTATIANQPYLLPSGSALRIEQLPACQHTNLKVQLEQCLATATRLGLEVLVLDQTRPDIGLPVVKVIVPGLRHFWARFAPGRLYDVPVQLGWLPATKTEAELNPIPMFL